MTKKDKKLLLSIALIGIVLLLLYFYGFKTITHHITDQTPTDITEIENTLTDEEREYYENRVLFEANLYSNSKNNGVELQELRLNYFTDPSLTSIATRGTGMQFIGDYKLSYNQVNNKGEANSFVPDDLYFYDTTVTNGDVISWNGGKLASTLNRNKSLIVKIDNKPYLLKLTACEEKKFLGILISGYYYGYDDIFVDCMKAIKTNSKGYGDYYITLDLSYFFTVYQYDEFANKWIENNVAKEVLTYSVLKFHYDENGAVKASQSMFGAIANDSQYNKCQYTIQFNANGGSGTMENQVLLNNVGAVINANAFYKLGYTFAGWNTKADGTGTSFEDKAYICALLENNKTETYYAQWAPIVYTIEFNANGGNGAMQNQLFTNDVAQAISTNTFTKDGYTFLGWIVQDGYTENKFNDSEVIKISNINLGKFDVISDRYEFKNNVLSEDYTIEFIALWAIDLGESTYQGTYSCDDNYITLGEQVVTEFKYNDNVYNNIETVLFEETDNTFIAHIKNLSGEYIYTISASDSGENWYLIDISNYNGSLIEQLRFTKS